MEEENNPKEQEGSPEEKEDNNQSIFSKEISSSSSQNLYEIFDNSKRASQVIKIFIALICVYSIGIIVSLMEHYLLIDLKLGSEISDSQLDMNDYRMIAMMLIKSIVIVATIIIFLRWFSRAYENLHKMGISNLKQSKSMAIVGWFIPILWFFIPYQIMNEIHVFTKENIQKFNKSFRANNLSFAILMWWMFFVVTSLIDLIVFKSYSRVNSLSDMISFSKLTMVIDAISIVEAFMLMNIVRKIAKMEDVLKEKVIEANGKVV